LIEIVFDVFLLLGEVHQHPEDTQEICDKGLKAIEAFVLEVLLMPSCITGFLWGGVELEALETGHVGEKALHVGDCGEGLE
jgi:hypothetical protein